MNLDLEEGKFLVETARNAIESYLNKRKLALKDENLADVFKEKRGVFVTLNTYPANRLRGCIGYPLAYEPLIDGVISSAVSAAFSDPRFRQLSKEELRNITVEVTVLSPMKLLDKKIDYKRQIKIGEDGLFIVCGQNSGLLLPQVPVEWKWTEDEFLREICIKAGLSDDCYENKNCDLYSFTGQIFKETEPLGEVVEEKN